MDCDTFYSYLGVFDPPQILNDIHLGGNFADDLMKKFFMLIKFTSVQKSRKFLVLAQIFLNIPGNSKKVEKLAPGVIKNVCKTKF